MRWPWQRGTVEAEKRLQRAEMDTQMTPEWVKYTRLMDSLLREEVARNGFGELLQIAMGGRRRPEGNQR